MARWLRTTAAAALCLVALAGCSNVAGAPVPPDSGGFHLAQVDRGPVTANRAIAAHHVSTPPGNEYEWTVTAVDPASRSLAIQYTDGACTGADRFDVEETATTVVVGITASKHFQGSCIAVGIPRSNTITLRKPLGGRALMEGATSIDDGLRKVGDPGLLPGPVCSASGGTGADVPVGMRDAASRIAPAAVTTAFVCRTWWPKGIAHTESTTLSDRASVAALASALDAGSHGLRAGAPASRCTHKDVHASWYAITLQGPGVRVEVRTDAILCDTVTNGAVSGTMTPALVHTLDALFSP